MNHPPEKDDEESIQRFHFSLVVLLIAFWGIGASEEGAGPTLVD
jgi:hypothetical protein